MILFRADGNELIGSGHIMRCLAIAESAIAIGEKCIFVLSDDNFKEKIAQSGHETIILNSDYKNLESEIVEFTNILKARSPQIVIVDSYFVTNNYLTHLHSASKDINSKLLYIDDICSFAYPCDILLNYNIYAEDLKGSYKNLYSKANVPTPNMLLGIKYVPLRKEFRNLPTRRIPRKKENADSILISTGGSDPTHMSLSLIEAIKAIPKSYNYKFHFLIGPKNSDIKTIQEACLSMPNIILHINAQNISAIMCSCDVAISAAGSTLYELCATQTPTIAYAIAENQILSLMKFNQLGISKTFTMQKNTNNANSLIQEAINLCQNFTIRVQMIQKSNNYIFPKESVNIFIKINNLTKPV